MSHKKPELYRGFVITPVRSGGFDVINSLTGKWVWRPTESSARWWAGTWARVQSFQKSAVKTVPRKVKVIKTRKLKGLRDNLPQSC